MPHAALGDLRTGVILPLPDSRVAKAQKPGVLLGFEGCDGSGKSTVLSFVAQRLVADLRQILITRWNSSPIFHPGLVDAKKSMALTPLTYCLGHCADFADRYDRQICPALDTGAVVLADRYCYTAYARDQARGLDLGYLTRLYSFARAPDLTILIDTPPVVALQRLRDAHRQPKPYEAGMDMGLSRDLESSFLQYQAMCRENYLAIARRFNMTVIDGTLPPGRMADAVWQAVCRVKGVC